MARVVLEKVSKIFPGGVVAVREIDLDIADREFVVLVGPSGCGKSTTLRMVAGLEEISGGTIRIGTRVVNDVPPGDRDIAMVFQNYALYPHMTVYKNMAFGLKLRGMPRDEIRKRVTEAARTLEIEHLLERKPKALSGGQRQRVAVGRAIVREPAAFLFDEPLSNLDAKLRVTTRAELKRLHQRLRTTTIYVTHDQEEAMTLGDRIVVMRDGIIHQVDSPLNVYRRPVNRFVAGFIGMPPMNFFDGVVIAAGDQFLFCERRMEPDSAGGGAAKSAGAGSEPGTELTLADNGFKLYMPNRLREALARWVGRRVVLGVRPEHMYLRPGGGSADGPGSELAPIDVKFNVIEPLGSDMDVYMSTALHDHVVGRLDADGSLQAGSAGSVFIDLRKVHVFEPGESGMNLSLTSEPAHAVA
jgi:multiple sugar transport system ATP-binding protein